MLVLRGVNGPSQGDTRRHAVRGPGSRVVAAGGTTRPRAIRFRSTPPDSAVLLIAAGHQLQEYNNVSGKPETAGQQPYGHGQGEVI